MQIDTGYQRPVEDGRGYENGYVCIRLAVGYHDEQGGGGHAPDEYLPCYRVARDVEINDNDYEYKPDLADKEDLRKYPLAQLLALLFCDFFGRTFFRYGRYRHFEDLA